MKIHARPLQQLISAIFASAGSNRDEADSIAEHLVKANLVGHDSHGVIRTPIYIQFLRDGKVFPNRSLNIIFDSGAMALADGELGFGQSIGKQVVELGLQKCTQQGVSVVALRNSGHLGRIGHWAEMAAAAGCISLHFVNTSGLGMFVVPAGGIDRRLSVNPVTIGVPVAGSDPVIFDIAAAATAEGKLKVARNKGVEVPDNWILNADGEPTNDPNQFYGPPGGSILPMGGHKGYGLCFMVELLAGALTGGGCSSAGKTLLEQGMLSVFIDPTKLTTQDMFGEEVTRYISFVKSSRPATPGGQVLVPGEIEIQNHTQRLAEGIDLDEKTWGEIVQTAQNADVDPALIEAAAG
ncbi:MAG: putative oxidoreductase [Pirellulaceae bacterium]|jgi:uncharacterized oxidoreductase